MLANRFGDVQDVTQVRRAVFIGRCPDGDEHHLGARDSSADVGREVEATLLLVTLDERIEPDAEAAAPEPESQAFEIFLSRRFRSTIEAMSAARNALDRVKSVDADGVPDPLPE